MRRPPPTTTLFPYTTLFRSRTRTSQVERVAYWPYARASTYESASSAMKVAALTAITLVARSEEHTSELQSQFHVVCRLLLEKKKYNGIQLFIAAVPYIVPAV